MTESKQTERSEVKDISPLEVYQIYRGRVVEEDAIINHRVSWLILVESITLTWWALIIGASFNSGLSDEFVRVAITVVSGAVSAVGIAIAACGVASIKAAKEEINRLNKEYNAIIEASPARAKYKIMDSIVGPDGGHPIGHKLSSSISPAFIVILTLSTITSAFVSYFHLLKVVVPKVP